MTFFPLENGGDIFLFCQNKVTPFLRDVLTYNYKILDTTTNKHRKGLKSVGGKEVSYGPWDLSNTTGHDGVFLFADCLPHILYKALQKGDFYSEPPTGRQKQNKQTKTSRKVCFS